MGFTPASIPVQHSELRLSFFPTYIVTSRSSPVRYCLRWAQFLMVLPLLFPKRPLTRKD